MSPPNIQNSNFAKTPKTSLFEPKQPIVRCSKNDEQFPWAELVTSSRSEE